MATVTSPTALYIMSVYNEVGNILLKIGISNDVTRRKHQLGWRADVLYHTDYAQPRSIVMANEFLAQAYALVKVGRPDNFRKTVKITSGQSEVFLTDNVKQAQGFVFAAKKTMQKFGEDVHAIVAYAIAYIKKHLGYVPRDIYQKKTRLVETFELDKKEGKLNG